uniref:Protein kinase domain-containing protein n=1 Tax=Oryza glumipatula TaxID=40148 RepID=A0A0D9Y7F7_9ORYZ
MIRKALEEEEGNLIQQNISAPSNSIPSKNVKSSAQQFGNLKIFKQEEIKLMTKNYSMKFREEFCERLYNGVIGTTHAVIVKQVRTSSESDRMMFLKTMSILSQKYHKNIANVAGFHLGDSISECVYESCCDLSQGNDGHVCFCNRNLYDIICTREKLPLHLRLSIAVQCAEGLVHIHSLLAENPDSHSTGLLGNFRSINIFLDKNFVPKVFNSNLSTFLGLSVMQKHTASVDRPNDQRSQIYYLDGRDISGQLFNPKSDVYSFGAVLLELITWKTVRYMSSGRVHMLTKDFLDTYRIDHSAAISFGKKVYDEQASGDNKPNQHVAPPLTKKFVKTPPTIVSIIPLNILEKITSNFSNDALIGEGPDARVFFGELSDGQKSAIKKLDPNEKIVVQVLTISRMLKHDNIVQILGYFIEGENRVLAYEYAPKEGVRGAQPGTPLSWEQRVKIALSAAKGLEFLHEKAVPPVIHTNIRSNNIFIFGNDVAKIGDLGVSKQLYPESDNDYYNTRLYPLRSFGYDAIAPETVQCKERYLRFGAVLLELLTGRKVVDYSLLRFQQSLITWATPRLSEDKVKQCVDPKLGGAFPLKAVAKVEGLFRKVPRTNPRPNPSRLRPASPRLLLPLVLRRPSPSHAAARLSSSLSSPRRLSLAPPPPRPRRLRLLPQTTFFLGGSAVLGRGEEMKEMVVGSVASAPVGRRAFTLWDNLSPEDLELLVRDIECRLPLPIVKLVSESSVLKVEERSVVEQGAEGHFGGEASRYPFSRRLGLAALILKGVSGAVLLRKKNVQRTTDLKKYIEAIKRFLHHSSSFYAVTINSTFIKQDRVYFTKEFSQNYIKPLMEGQPAWRLLLMSCEDHMGIHSYLMIMLLLPVNKLITIRIGRFPPLELLPCLLVLHLRRRANGTPQAVIYPPAKTHSANNKKPHTGATAGLPLQSMVLLLPSPSSHRRRPRRIGVIVVAAVVVVVVARLLPLPIGGTVVVVMACHREREEPSRERASEPVAKAEAVRRGTVAAGGGGGKELSRRWICWWW